MYCVAPAYYGLHMSISNALCDCIYMSVRHSPPLAVSHRMEALEYIGGGWYSWMTWWGWVGLAWAVKLP